MKALLNWFDSRTGYKAVVNDVLFEPVPGGARWRYVWGSTLMFTFTVQVITGLFLWMTYSPSSQTAWESVFYISFVQEGGWFLRGLHHFTAQAMIVLLALHLMQVVIDGAYKAPREVNFWLGLILMQIVLALSLTGYLLPWDQKGYWATRVATNLAGLVPMIGPEVQKLAVGGSEYGNQTLTRFFALHAGVLPAMLVGFVALHIYTFRLHGLTVPKHLLSRKNAYFWPDQVLKDAVACGAVLVVVLGFVLWNKDVGGAELTAPADAANEYSAARPEWYFLFLFQLLKLEAFQGEYELTESLHISGEALGALYVPGAVMGVMFLMPFIGRWKLGHYFNVGFIFALMAGAGWLTYEAVKEDLGNPNFQAAKAYAEHKAHLTVELVKAGGVPPEGTKTLMTTDPQIHAPELFSANCAICHRINGHNGKLIVPEVSDATNLQNAADLGGFASRKYIRGLLDVDKVMTHHYYGGRENKDNDMTNFVRDNLDPEAYSDDEKKLLAEQLDAVAAALSAEAALPYQTRMDAKDQKLIERGRNLILGEGDEDAVWGLGGNCTDCHSFRDVDNGEFASAPTLTGYGSRQWLNKLIHNVESTDPLFYPTTNEGMPLFGAEDKLTAQQIDLITVWLRSVKQEIEPGLEPAAKADAALEWVEHRNEELAALKSEASLAEQAEPAFGQAEQPAAPAPEMEEPEPMPEPEAEPAAEKLEPMSLEFGAEAEK